MANRAASLLVWGAIALLVILPYALYKPFAAHVASPVFYGACLIIAALAVSGLRSGKTPREVVQSLAIENYLQCGALLAGAYGWGWLTAHVLGLGTHFFGAVVVAVPALALLVTAGNIAFRALYQDLGLGAPEARNAKKAKKQKKMKEKGAGKSAA